MSKAVLKVSSQYIIIVNSVTHPGVPEQSSGERVVFPGAAPCSPLPLNGHCVNPLKVNPPAAVTRQSRTTRWREGTRKGKKKREKTTGNEKEMCSCGSHAERAKQIVM